MEYTKNLTGQLDKAPENWHFHGRYPSQVSDTEDRIYHYRNATLIVRGECTGPSTKEDLPSSDVDVKVIASDQETLDTVVADLQKIILN